MNPIATLRVPLACGILEITITGETPLSKLDRADIEAIGGYVALLQKSLSHGLGIEPPSNGPLQVQISNQPITEAFRRQMIEYFSKQRAEKEQLAAALATAKPLHPIMEPAPTGSWQVILCRKNRLPLEMPVNEPTTEYAARQAFQSFKAQKKPGPDSWHELREGDMIRKTYGTPTRDIHLCLCDGDETHALTDIMPPLGDWKRGLADAQKRAPLTGSQFFAAKRGKGILGILTNPANHQPKTWAVVQCSNYGTKPINVISEATEAEARAIFEPMRSDILPASVFYELRNGSTVVDAIGDKPKPFLTGTNMSQHSPGPFDWLLVSCSTAEDIGEKTILEPCDEGTARQMFKDIAEGVVVNPTGMEWLELRHGRNIVESAGDVLRNRKLMRCDESTIPTMCARFANSCNMLPHLVAEIERRRLEKGEWLEVRRGSGVLLSTWAPPPTEERKGLDEWGVYFCRATTPDALPLLAAETTEERARVLFESFTAENIEHSPGWLELRHGRVIFRYLGHNTGPRHITRWKLGVGGQLVKELKESEDYHDEISLILAKTPLKPGEWLTVEQGTGIRHKVTFEEANRLTGKPADCSCDHEPGKSSNSDECPVHGTPKKWYVRLVHLGGPDRVIYEGTNEAEATNLFRGHHLDPFTPERIELHHGEGRQSIEGRNNTLWPTPPAHHTYGCICPERQPGGHHEHPDCPVHGIEAPVEIFDSPPAENLTARIMAENPPPSPCTCDDEIPIASPSCPIHGKL